MYYVCCVYVLQRCDRVLRAIKRNETYGHSSGQFPSRTRAVVGLKKYKNRETKTFVLQIKHNNTILTAAVVVTVQT